jgi:hypothetical protein
VGSVGKWTFYTESEEELDYRGIGQSESRIRRWSGPIGNLHAGRQEGGLVQGTRQTERENWLSTYESIWHHNPEEHHLHHCENLISNKEFIQL